MTTWSLQSICNATTGMQRHTLGAQPVNNVVMRSSPATDLSMSPYCTTAVVPSLSECAMLATSPVWCRPVDWRGLTVHGLVAHAQPHFCHCRCTALESCSAYTYMKAILNVDGHPKPHKVVSCFRNSSYHQRAASHRYTAQQGLELMWQNMQQTQTSTNSSWINCT